AATQYDRDAEFMANCNAWSQNLRDHLLATEPYDAVLVTSSRSKTVAADPGSSVEESATRGLTEAWSALQARGSQVIVLADVPRVRDDVVGCVEMAGPRANESCSVPRDEAFGIPDRLLPAAEAAGDVPVI